jgi:formylglycine-generating enzyme required for sulfatase activity
VELAAELAARGVNEAPLLLDAFFAEAATYGLDSTDRMAPLWGDEFDPARCNTREAGPHKTTPVGAYPEGASAHGCYDMAGNVWEWSASLWSEQEPYRVLRGGSWLSRRDFAACSYRSNERPLHRSYNVGFVAAYSDEMGHRFRCKWGSIEVSDAG